MEAEGPCYGILCVCARGLIGRVAEVCWAGRSGLLRPVVGPIYQGSVTT